MEFFRIINPQFYDIHKTRFTSQAFQYGDDDAISIINIKCALSTSENICNHIRNFYNDLYIDTHIFWKVPLDKLPDTKKIEKKDSPTGDKCHHNLTGVDDKARRRLLRNVPLSDFFVCLNGNFSILSEDVAKDLKQQAEQKQQHS